MAVSSSRLVDMGYYHMTGTGETIPITLQPGYVYILRHFHAQVTGTSTAVSSLIFAKNNNNDIVLSNIASTSTVLTVYESIDYNNSGVSGVNTNVYLASKFEFTSDDLPVLYITNNGSVSWEMTLEERIA